jgi:hypothetical protein
VDLAGIENEAEFFPAGTLSDVLEVELQDIASRWSKDLKGANPITRLSSSADAYTRTYRQLLNTTDKSVRAELYADLTSRAANALGYEIKRGSETLALDTGSLIRVLNKTFDADGKPVLWILETPKPTTGEEQADPLNQTFDKDQFAADEAEYAETDLAVEELLAEGIFDLADAPRYVLVAGASQWVLVDQRKWPARSVLRFDLQEIFSRQDRDTYRVMACLIAREARVPVTGVPISDRLEEEAQRNANLVTTSLKKTVRDAIELLGQEVLDVTAGKFPTGPKRGVWIDGPTLSLECLRYMYRLLFLLYAESNPRLKILDLKDPLYASGYSMEALRDLESVRLRTPQEKRGTYLWKSLQQVLRLLYSGENHVLRLPAVKVSLLDPESTPLLNSVELRNEAVQKIIRLLSLRSNNKSTGRISYSKLGIGQLGAVYETLISFTGTVCKEDMIELKGDSKDRAAVEVDPEEDADAPESIDLIEGEAVESRIDKVDLLAPTYFVPRRRIGEFNPEAVVFEGTQAKIYPKGSFTYRLAGRDREKTAAYYTPEPLARLLVKHLLMERCKDLKAGEILELKILEPAMGSAAFLVETTNQLADLYLERKQVEIGRVIPQEDIILEKQKVRSYIADRNCFGVDLNPTAVELGAISLWLNGLHKGEFSPWFGDQLHAGNSLIGARRAVYPVSQLKGKGADLWLKHPPKEIGWKEARPENTVYQWLLPAEDMAAFEKDKSISSFAGKHQERIKAWRKAGFYKPLEQHEINLVQRLTKVADELFEIVASELARTRDAANDEITLWPEQTMVGAKGVGYQKKEILKQRLLGEDHAQNTLPFKRLKTAMDAWCALWLWPIEQADKLPSRREFLEGMRILLEGGFSADGSLSAGAEDDFATPMADMFEQKVAADSPKYNMGLFQETNVEAFIEEYDWLQVATKVAEEARFVHYDLIFADILKTRGGFDLIVGNPPWAKPRWILSEKVSDVDPIYLGISASQAQKTLTKEMFSREVIKGLRESLGSEKGAINFFGAHVNYPLSSSASSNLYRNFIELSFYLLSDIGNAGLIHQDGHLASPGNDLLRFSWYRRILKCFEFSNQISSKNFSEVLNTRRFSLNIYRGQEGRVYFEKLTNMFLASQVEGSYHHDGLGSVPGIRTESGWNTEGHKERVVTISSDYLRALGKFMPEELSNNPTLLHPINRSTEKILKKLLSMKSIADSDINLCFDRGGSEQDLLNSGYVEKIATWPKPESYFLITSPSIFVGDSCLKTPRSDAKNFKHYVPVENTSREPYYRPRTMFHIRDEADLVRKFYNRPSFNGKYHYEEYRFAYRQMVDAGASRTLVGTILPPKYLHHSQLVSFSAETEDILLSVSAIFMSVISDYLIKSILTKNLYGSTLNKLPYTSLNKTTINRVLLLVSRNLEYKNIFDRNISHMHLHEWSFEHQALRSFKNRYANGLTTENYNLNALERRFLEIEIDVLVALQLGLTLDELENIYGSFELLERNDRSTFYDKKGDIAYSKASGFERVGFVDQNGNPPSFDQWSEIIDSDKAQLRCIAADDTARQSQVTVERKFEPPYSTYARTDDYRRAWKYFSGLMEEGEL